MKEEVSLPEAEITWVAWGHTPGCEITPFYIVTQMIFYNFKRNKKWSPLRCLKCNWIAIYSHHSYSRPNTKCFHMHDHITSYFYLLSLVIIFKFWPHLVACGTLLP